jgi:glycosyltransferase involved in cell wall biosynthesis
VLETLYKEKYEIFALLTGPSRGYVINRLNNNGVKFLYKFFSNKWSLNELYSICDAYIVSSRIEGGPNALLECLATGVSIVTTNVGMVPNIIIDGYNGFVVDVDDKDKIVSNLIKIFNESSDERDIRTINGYKAVQNYSWVNIIKLFDLLYENLINIKYEN